MFNCVKLIIYSILLVLIASCSKKLSAEKQTLISINIENSDEDLIIIKDNEWQAVDTVWLENGQVNNKTIFLEHGNYYSIKIDGKIAYLYCNGRDDIDLSVDANDFYNTLNFKITEKASNHNNYLAEKNRIWYNLNDKRFYNNYAALDEPSFLNETDSVFNLYYNNLEKNKPSLEPTFYNLEKNSINIDKALRLEYYEGQRRMVTKNNEFKVSEGYPNPFLGIDMNDANLLRTSNYLRLLHSYYQNKVSQIQKETQAEDYYILLFSELAKLDIDAQIRDKLAMFNAKYALGYSSDIHEIHKIFEGFVKDEQIKTEFNEMYLAKIQEIGAPAPSFNFVDEFNKEHALDDFFGKYIYIDIWATWCGPCINEQPSLDKLAEEYSHKINFISISWNDNKSNWKQYAVKANNPITHLYASDKNAEFFTFFSVTAIPRFILLDKEGKILESRAKVPRDPQLKELFDSLE